MERFCHAVTPLVLEHANAIFAALVDRPADAASLPHGGVLVEAALDSASLRVAVIDACADRGPDAVTRGAPGLPQAAVDLVERLADRWGVSCDRELRAWFEIDV